MSKSLCSLLSNVRSRHPDQDPTYEATDRAAYRSPTDRTGVEADNAASQCAADAGDLCRYIDPISMLHGIGHIYQPNGHR